MHDMGKETLEAVISLLRNTMDGFKQLMIALEGLELTADGFDLTAFGVTLAEFFFVLEFFVQVTNFHFERVEDAVKIGLKLVVAKVIIENSSRITGVIYNAFFKKYGISSIVTAMSSWSDGFASVTNTMTDDKAGLLGINYLCEALIMLIVWIIIMGMLIKMTAQVAGILFEIAVHQAIAPVALSTLCNDTAKSAGISFIKSYSAVCLQAMVIAICFTAYSPLYSALSSAHSLFWNNTTSATGSAFIVDALTILSPIISMIILSTAVTRSGDITKRMLGA